MRSMTTTSQVDNEFDVEYLNMILSSMAGSLIVIGGEATIKIVNQATLDLTGYTEEELIGQPFDMLLIGNPFKAEGDRLSNSGFVRQGERVYKTKDGQHIPVSFSSSIMRDEHKRVMGIVCVAQDISHHKQMEAELNHRAQQLEILHQFDEELTHMLKVDPVLDMALDIAMRLSAADAGGIALYDGEHLVPAHSVGYPYSVDETAHISNGVIARVVRRKQAERIVSVHDDPYYVPVLSATNAMIVIPLLSQDSLVGVLYLETAKPEHFSVDTYEFIRLTTARMSAAIHNAQLYELSHRRLSELQVLYARVSALEQIKTDMIRIAAHDLRNPLNNIVLSSRILRRTTWEVLNDVARERMMDIEQSADRMQKITGNILSLERINQAAAGESKVMLDLQIIIQQAYEAHRGQASLKELTFILELSEEPLFVWGDAIELHEAAANFISNAIKYTPERGRIIVSVERNGSFAVFEVRDNGYGIPEDQQAQLFQPFYRADTKETQEIDGTGLGLHLVKNIIERHKGQIRFKSQRGEGSTFGFNLPIVTQVMSNESSRLA